MVENLLFNRSFLFLYEEVVLVLLFINKFFLFKMFFMLDKL